MAKSKYQAYYDYTKNMVEYIAEWEMHHGTASLIVPCEYEEFMQGFMRAMINSSPRAAVSIVDPEMCEHIYNRRRK